MNDFSCNILVASIFILLLSGCSSTVCSNNQDGNSLVESLSNPARSLDEISDSILKLLSDCQIAEKHNKFIEKSVVKIASEGTAKLQYEFYKQLTLKNANTPFRSKFLENSTLVNGGDKSNDLQFNLVVFEKLGKPIEYKSLPPEISKKLDKLRIDKLDSQLIRLVETGDKTLVFARRVGSDNTDKNTISFDSDESSVIFVFDYISGAQILFPDVSFKDFGVSFDGSTKKSLVDYFFNCPGAYGGDCSVRDSRFVVDREKRLKYIVSIVHGNVSARDGNSIGRSHCSVEMSGLQVLDNKITINSNFNAVKEIPCESLSNVSDHVDPFRFYSNENILSKFKHDSEAIDLDNLINFTVKDFADRDLKSRLWSQGSRWKGKLLAKSVQSFDNELSTIVTSIGIGETDSLVRKLLELLEVESKNISNVKWLLSKSSDDLIFERKLSQYDVRIKSLNVKLNSIVNPSKPVIPGDSDFEYVRATIAIQREAENSEVIHFPDYPYVYVGFVYDTYPPKRAIVSSPTPLVDRPGIVSILARSGRRPSQFVVNGFTQDFWHFTTFSAEDKLAYDEYVKKQQAYPKLLSAYESAMQKNWVEIDHVRIALSQLKNELDADVYAASSK